MEKRKKGANFLTKKGKILTPWKKEKGGVFLVVRVESVNTRHFDS